MKRVAIAVGALLAVAVVAAAVRTLQFHGAAKPGVHVLGIVLSWPSN